MQGVKSPPPPGRLEVWPSTLSWGPSRGTAGGKPGALPAALVWVAPPLGLGRRRIWGIEKKRAKDCRIKASRIPSQSSSDIEDKQTARRKLALGKIYLLCSSAM